MTSKPSVAIGCDDAALQLKETLREYVESLGYEVADFGIYRQEPVLYPDVAFAVATSITQGQHQRGILLCGTGIGMAISANKVPGIRAAQAHDTYSAERARKSNDAHIVTLGARVIGPELAKQIVKSFLESDFQGGGSTAKVARIESYERALAVERSGSPKD